jgi:hypothetical protein
MTYHTSGGQRPLWIISLWLELEQKPRQARGEATTSGRSANEEISDAVERSNDYGKLSQKNMRKHAAKKPAEGDSIAAQGCKNHDGVIGGRGSPCCASAEMGVKDRRWISRQ